MSVRQLSWWWAGRLLEGRLRDPCHFRHPATHPPPVDRVACAWGHDQLQSERTKPDSVGMGSYNSDSHIIQRVAMPDGTVQNEGDVQVPVQPYEIPYRTITPKAEESENLFVPVCLSATHASYSSVRMEPQYMILGQAAGEAAALAIQKHTTIQAVPIADLQKKLRDHGAILHLSQEF